jgi:hypothetical protein
MNLRDEVIQRMTRVILIRPSRHALVVRLAVNRWAALKVVHYRFGEALPTPPSGPSGATKDHRSANARSAAALQMANQVWRIVWTIRRNCSSETPRVTPGVTRPRSHLRKVS